MEQFKLDNSGSNDQKDSIKPNADFSGGPNFGQVDDWNDEPEGWFSKYGSTVVLPIIAILVLAGGIYLYATQKSTTTNSDETAQEQNNEDIALIDENSDNQGNNQNQPAAETNQPQEKPSSQDIEVIKPASNKPTNGFTEKASKGEGVTNLARRALKNYLTNNPQQASKLTNEHKVFIEDYLKDKTGSRLLEVDEELTFSSDLMSEAVNAALTLSDIQLQHLKQYSALVAW